MDADKANELISQLSENVSGLKEALEPLMDGDLNDTASKLPVLDRAKLYIFVAYTIESILFSNLRLQGIDAKDHPVYTEIVRVRQYFEKVKVAEQGEEKPNLRLDKAATGRIVKHHLAANKAKGTMHRFDTDNTGSEADSKFQRGASIDNATFTAGTTKERTSKKSSKSDAAKTKRPKG